MTKKISALAITLCALSGSAWGQVYQLPNSDFEADFVQGYYKTNLGSATTTKEAPNWHGFPTMDGGTTIVNTGRKQGDKMVQSTDVRPGSTGTKSVYIKATKVGVLNLTKLANGVITSGRVYSNDTEPTNAANNYNYSPGGTYTSNKNSNTNFTPTFNGKPDMMRVWVKFDAKDATKSSSYPYASVKAVLHNNNRYQDPEAADYSQVKIASAIDTEVGKNGYGEWQKLEIPFTYYEGLTDDTPAYMYVGISTNAQAGAGTEGDILYIDDLEFVYYKTLKSLSVNNSSVTLEDGVYDYTVKGTYTDGCITATTTSPFANVSVGSYDATTHSVKLTVTANNGDTQDYTLKFVPDASTIDATYKSQIVVGEGEDANYSFNDVTLKPNTDNTMNFGLKGFAFAGMEIGNVNVENVPIAWGTDGNITLTCSKNIDVEVTNPEAEGLGLSDLPMTLNATVNPTTQKLSANLTITWEDSEIKVNVTPQPISYTIDENNNVKVTSGTLDDNALLALFSLVQNIYVPSFDFRGTTITTTMLGDLIDAFVNTPFYVDENCNVEGSEKAIKNGVVSGTYIFTDQYDEGDTTPSLTIPEDFTAASISYPREFNTTSGYASTFILPFAFDVPEGVTIASLSRVDGNTLYFAEVKKTEANKPYVVITDKSNFVDNLTNVAVKKTVGESLTTEVDGVKHIGVYATQSVAGVYGYSAGKFIKANSGTVKPFRTYIEVPNTTSSAPKAFNLAIENPVTGISQIVGKMDATDAPVYNLQGVRQNSTNLSKGVYIVNGKKLIK